MNREKRVDLRPWLIGATALLVLGGIALILNAPTPEDLPVVEAQAPVVQVLELESREIVPKVRLSGLLEPDRSVEILAEAEGRVIEVGAEELARVEEGQLLARLDPTRAQIALARAEAARERAKSQTTLARSDLERSRGLAKRDAASRAALDQAENASRLARAATLDAEAGIADAQDQLAKTTISAPFGGVLRTFPVERGEYLRPGERVAELLDVDRLRVTIGVSDRQVVSIEPGSVAQLRVDALPGEPFTGRVVQVGSAMDPSNRKFPVRIEVPNEEGRLLPGMVAEVELALNDARALVLVPREAVLEEFALRHVFVVERRGEGPEVAARRRVEVRELPFEPTVLEIRSGVEAGDRVVLTGLNQLQDGMPVRAEPRPAAPGLASGAAPSRAGDLP